MVKQGSSVDPLPRQTVTMLLQIAVRRYQQGDQVGACALLRMLAVQRPGEARIWLMLATMAETRDEQRRAFEQVLAIEPDNQLARRGLAGFGAAAADVATLRPVVPTQAAVMPVVVEEQQGVRAKDLTESVPVPVALAPAPVLAAPVLEPPPPSPRLWSLLFTVVVLTLFVVMGWLFLHSVPSSDQAMPTPPLPNLGQVPTLFPRPSAVVEPSVPASAVPTVAASREPARPTRTSALVMGQVVMSPPWHASLLRSDYAVPLDSGIGELQPHGRFFLVLMTIGNDGTTSARIPADLFTLVDGRGHRYLPLVAASSAYLDIYGHGQRGDVSMADLLPPDGANLSVPLIFDLPLDARGLVLFFRDRAEGWSIGDVMLAVPNHHGAL